jgi:SAM-dependent methyltransferase
MGITAIVSRYAPTAVRPILRWIRHLGQLPETRCVRFQGHPLPPPGMRFCGADFHNDVYFVQSAVEEAERLRDVLGLGPASRMLEVGCGPGRTAIGLLYASIPLGRYDGVDVNRRSIEWCRTFISQSHPEYHFSLVDAKNEDFNPRGREMTPAFSLPFDPGAFDIIYAYALYTNLIENEARIYTREFRRLLSPGGKVFLTAFVEEGVPPVTVNPENYVIAKCEGPCHLVRYEKGRLFSIFESCAFEVERFDHGTEWGLQSGIYLRPRSAAVPPNSQLH